MTRARQVEQREWRGAQPAPRRCDQDPETARLLALQAAAGNRATAQSVAPVAVQRVPIRIRHNGALLDVEPRDLVLDILGRLGPGTGSTFLQEVEEVLTQVAAAQGPAAANAIITDPAVYPVVQARLQDMAAGPAANARTYGVVLRRMYAWFGIPPAAAVAAPTAELTNAAWAMCQPATVVFDAAHVDARHFWQTFFGNVAGNVRDANGFFPLGWTPAQVRAVADAVLVHPECVDAVAHALANGTAWGNVQVSLGGYLFYLGFGIVRPAAGPPRLHVRQFYLRRGTPTFTRAQVHGIHGAAAAAGGGDHQAYLDAVADALRHLGQPD